MAPRRDPTTKPAPGLPLRQRWRRWWHRLSPPALFLWSFVVLIVVGTVGLVTLPGLQTGARMSLVDAVFTMTSAVTITGLVVVDTATRFTAAGQVWILVFVQIGGIGLVTLTSLLIGALGRQLSLRSEMLAMAPTRREDRPEVWELALRVTRFSLVVEGLGAVVLFALWLPRFPVEQAAWHAIFHGVMAYCNAGFSTFSDSLIGLRDSSLSLVVISTLVIVGGFGYLTFEELVRWGRAAFARRVRGRLLLRAPHRLSTHTYVVISTSAVLLVAGWLLFAVFEWSDTLGPLSTLDKIWNAWFMSVTPRSGGFNTVDYGQIGNDSSTLTMILMFIGGSPGSTAGGIKTTTIAVLFALGLSRMRGRRYVGLRDRAIPEGTLERTVGVFLLAVLVSLVGFFLLGAIEGAGLSARASRDQFLPIAFEALSASATVGLSMNVTPTLQDASKLIVSGLMFIGRVGLLAFFSALVLRRAAHPAFLRPAQEDVIVG
ncbi:MAG: potassium transporter Trk [Myxococcota bacterium]|nr:potassium transporter Trk [Myxococcota bacterium]